MPVATSALAQAIQVAAETTPGTPATTGFKKFTALSLAPIPKVPTDRFRPMGYKFPTQVTPGKDSSETDVEGRACYRHILYPLSSLFGAAAVTTPDSVNAPTARQHAFSLSSTSPSTPQTYTVERTRGGVSVQSAHAQFSSLSLAVGRETVELSGSLFARGLTTGITPAAGATEIAAMLMVPKSWDVYLDSTSAALGTTKLVSSFTAEWTLNDRYGPLYYVNSAQPSFGDVVETEPDATLTLRIVVNAVTDGYLANLRNGDTRFVRLESIGPVIGGAVTYKFTLDMAVKFEEPGDEGDEDGALATDIKLAIVHDPTWGRAISATVVNDLAGL